MKPIPRWPADASKGFESLGDGRSVDATSIWGYLTTCPVAGTKTRIAVLSREASLRSDHVAAAFQLVHDKARNGANVLVTVTSCLLGRPNMPSSVLGTGRGIDHMVIAVGNLEQAIADYAELGFAMAPFGRHPNGVGSAGALFDPDGYLELIAVYGADLSGGREVMEFLTNGEGAPAVGLATSSAAHTASHLRGRGLEVRGPADGTITYEGIDETPPVLWRYVEIVTPLPYLSDRLFFVEYDNEAHAELYQKHPELDERLKPHAHTNGARGISSFWLAVDNLESAARSYASVGFPVGPEMAISHVQAAAREVEVGQGTILLLQSIVSSGPVTEFLERRKASAGWMGTTLRVDDVQVLKQVLPPSIRSRCLDEVDREKRGCLIPPELTHGVWIEFMEGPGKGSVGA